MSATVRQLQMLDEARQRCESKRRYSSWVEAEHEAIELIEDLRDGKLPINKGMRILAYRCMFGDHWHIGHQKPSLQKRLAHAQQESQLMAATP